MTDNITTGHWVFAAIFMIVFIGYLIWSYRKDAVIHNKYYGNGAKVLLGIILVIFLLFIFKRLF
jgi:hypothetical protein